MAAGKRTSVVHFRGLWTRRRKNDIVYELKIGDLSASYPIGFPLDYEEKDPPREVITWWKEKTLQKERTGIGLPTPKKMDDVAEEAFARFDERVELGKASARTAKLYRGDYARYIEPTFGNTFVHKIRHDDVLDWVRWLRTQDGQGGKKFAEWTLHGKLTVLRHLLKYARRTGAVDFDVFDRIDPADLPGQDHREEFDARALTIPELNRLVEAATEEERTAIVVLGWTGLRRGECAGLLWSDLDLVVDQEIKLTRQLGDLVDGEPTRVKLKNKWSREVTLFTRAREELIEHLGREQAKGRGNPEDFVFVDDDGRVRNIAWYSNMVKRVGERAKLGHVTPQVLRRTAATIFAYNEIPIHVAAQMLGHSIAVFSKHYVQVWRDAQARKEMREAMEKVEGFGSEVAAE